MSTIQKASRRQRCRTQKICVRRVAGKRIYYRFLEHPAQYFVDCRYGQERICLPLGHTHRSALALFTLLVQGSVTPCTMADVLSDLQKETV